MALVADVFKVLVVDANDNVLASDTLSDANIEITQETKDVEGGGSVIAILHGKRDINITLTDPEWKFENLALHLGQDIVTGEGIGYAMPKWYTVTDNAGSLTITLDETPIDETIKVYDADGKPVVVSDVTGMDVTVTGVADGDKVEVRTYQYKTDVTTETIDIDVAKFPKDCKLILETIEISNDEQPIAKLQYQFDRAKPSSDFKINTTTNREASNTESNFRILKPKDSTVMGRALRIPFSA